MKEIQQLEFSFAHTIPFMCATAFHFIGSQDLAQDITQEVIIKFWQNKEDLEIRFIENFLYTMIKNEALNYLRGVERENKRISKLEIETSEDSHVLNLLIAKKPINYLSKPLTSFPHRVLGSCVLSCQDTKTRKSLKSWEFP